MPSDRRPSPHPAPSPRPAAAVSPARSNSLLNVARRRRAFLAAALLAAAAGCDGRPTANYSTLNLAEVGGRVTLDGQPLEGAVVRFYKPGNRARYAYGQTDADGAYSLRYNSRQAGVTPGPKEVRISTAVTGPEVKGGGGPERVPVRYNRDTELTATVDRNGSHTFDFDLTSDGEIAEPDAGLMNEEAGSGD